MSSDHGFYGVLWILCYITFYHTMHHEFKNTLHKSWSKQTLLKYMEQKTYIPKRSILNTWDPPPHIQTIKPSYTSNKNVFTYSQQQSTTLFKEDKNHIFKFLGTQPPLRHSSRFPSHIFTTGNKLFSKSLFFGIYPALNGWTRCTIDWDIGI